MRRPDVLNQLGQLVRRLRGSREGTPSKRPARAEPEWVLLESVHSAAMGSLYQQVLMRAGIPVMEREFGGGSALLGGVPVGVSLFVPRDRLQEALDILGQEPALEAGQESRTSSEHAKHG